MHDFETKHCESVTQAPWHLTSLGASRGFLCLPSMQITHAAIDSKTKTTTSGLDTLLRLACVVRLAMRIRSFAHQINNRLQVLLLGCRQWVRQIKVHLSYRCADSNSTETQAASNASAVILFAISAKIIVRWLPVIE